MDRAVSATVQWDASGLRAEEASASASDVGEDTTGDSVARRGVARVIGRAEDALRSVRAADCGVAFIDGAADGVVANLGGLLARAIGRIAHRGRAHVGVGAHLCNVQAVSGSTIARVIGARVAIIAGLLGTDATVDRMANRSKAEIRRCARCAESRRRRCATRSRARASAVAIRADVGSAHGSATGIRVTRGIRVGIALPTGRRDAARELASPRIDSARD